MRRGSWNWLRVTGGYGLFAVAIAYVVYTAPGTVWHLQPHWLILSIVMLLLLIVMQVLQVAVFLKAHGIGIEARWVISFTVKRGLLNAVIPVRGGTLMMMRAMTMRYAVRWQEYLLFNVISGMVSMLWSILALVWLVFGTIGVVVFTLVGLLAIYLLIRLKSIPYWSSLPSLVWLAGGLYITILLVFWSLLNGMGLNVPIRDAMYFAVALNALAQISVTPGNFGVREWVMGILAPYLALPVSLGILAGGVFHVLRVLVYGLILMIVGLGTDFQESKAPR